MKGSNKISKVNSSDLTLILIGFSKTEKVRTDFHAKDFNLKAYIDQGQVRITENRPIHLNNSVGNFQRRRKRLYNLLKIDIQVIEGHISLKITLEASKNRYLKAECIQPSTEFAYQLQSPTIGPP
jgi:hypothetical protein